MLPGLICDERTFVHQMASFPGALAMPGYGDADTIAAMADAVLAAMPQRVSLLGHSMGARVALEVVRSAPERVERLALVSTGVHPVRPGEAEKRLALADLRRRKGMEALVRVWLPPMVSPARRDDAGFMAPIEAMCLDAGIARFDADVAALLSRPEVARLLPSLRCPVLVAVGADDQWSPPTQHAAIAVQIPGSKLVVIEGAGHMLPLERPDRLNEAIRDWLDDRAS